MRYGSVCSGIEAATVAWKPLGWEASFFSEIEKFPRNVLSHHYSDTAMHGDFTTIKENEYDPIELLVGGTPCQSFSVAGLRKGLDDPRGNLMLEFGALARRLRPQWLVWENVPGVLSSNGGRDFGSFLGMLGQLGYGFAYRVLDAQYFGIPQRRRRVFVVGYIGDWRRAAAVLFERHSLSGDSAPSRKEGEEIAKCITRGIGTRYDFETDTFAIAGNIIGREPEHGGNGDGWSEGISYTLTKTDQHAVAHTFKVRGGCEGGGKGYLGQDEKAFTLSTGQDQQLLTPSMQVRRLTPKECERLQGFPDDYTNVPGASDSARYKALGNSMAVPVMEWIGERIQMVSGIKDAS